MDPRHCAQDVLRCDLCDTPVPSMYCDICHIKLCVACVGVHLSDQSKDHKVLPFEKRGSTTKCPKHSTKICELHCEQCNIPICASCVLSKEHQTHEVVDIMKSLTNKKETIKRDLEELEKTIFPKYQTAASNIPALKTDAREHFHKLKTALQKQGETLHKEIDTIIQKMQSEIDDMSTKHLTVIGKQEDAINHTITEIEQTILDLKKLLNTSDVCHVSKYKSKNEEFRRVPVQFQVTLPTFTPQKINVEKIYQQLDFLSHLVIATGEECTMKTSGDKNSIRTGPWPTDEQLSILEKEQLERLKEEQRKLEILKEEQRKLEILKEEQRKHFRQLQRLRENGTRGKGETKENNTEDTQERKED